MWPGTEEMRVAVANEKRRRAKAEALTKSLPPAPVHPEFAPLSEVPAAPAVPERKIYRVPQWHHGWPVPSSIMANPAEARACIQLPTFEPETLEKAQTIAGFFPIAETEYRNLRGKARGAQQTDTPHFERIFRIAAALASIPDVEETKDYDEALILTAWHCVRPGVEGFLGSYPKSLLCPLSHAAPPIALESLS